jgi:AcrR family transcriptional regulator
LTASGLRADRPKTNRRDGRQKNNKGKMSERGEVKAGLGEILRQACRLMAKNGYHGTSMRDIAQETGRSLSGLYHYFRSKEDIIFLINHHGFTTLNDMLGKMERSFDRPGEKLYAFVYCHTRYFTDHLDEMRVMTWGTHELPVERADAIQALKDRYTGAARDIVGAVYREASGDDLDAQRLSRETFILFGMLNWIFGWYSPARYGRVEDLVGDIYRTFLHGLAGPDGGGKDIDQMAARLDKWFSEQRATRMW